MNTFEILEEKIQNMQDEKIIKTKRNPIQSIIIAVVGIALLIIGIVAVNNETISMLLVVAGIISAITGIILIAINSGKNAFDYTYEPTGKKMKKYKIYLNDQDARIVLSCINTNDFQKINQLKKSMDTKHLLEGRGSDDGEIFLFQISDYVPHSYVPSSPVIMLRGNDAKKMLGVVKS